MPERRILFVDDRKDDLANLQQVIGGLGQAWKSDIVESGNDALSAIKEKPVHVIVTEANLPDMTGSMVLRIVKDIYPGTLRFMMSSQSNRKLLLQASEYTHQFIAKPVKPAVFVKILDNSLGLRTILDNKKIHATLAAIDILPSPPKLYNELVSLLQSEDTTSRQVADLVEQDISVTAKLLQLSNSAFFGLPNPVETPLRAINVLGLDTVQSLVLASGTFDQFDDPGLPGFSIDDIYNKSVRIGSNARNIANCFGLQKRQAEDSFMAGILHDIGKLVLLKYFPMELSEALRLSDEKSIPLHEAEKEILGVDHAEIGAHLLSLWGLHDPILEAVAFHPSPNKSSSPLINVLTAVHIAYGLSCDKRDGSVDEQTTALDIDYLGKLDLTEKLRFIERLCDTEKKETHAPV